MDMFDGYTTIAYTAWTDNYRETCFFGCWYDYVSYYYDGTSSTAAPYGNITHTVIRHNTDANRYGSLSGTMKNAVSAHEVGHGLGLSHPCTGNSCGSIMREPVLSGGATYVTAYDINSILMLYP